MTLKEFVMNLKRLSSKLVIVDPEGHEVFSKSLGMFVNWIHKSYYGEMYIDYVQPDGAFTYVIYLEG